MVTMCVFEFFSAVLTTFRCIQALSVNGPWWKQKKCFTYLVLEQGVLYFCVVAVLTISSLVLNFTIHVSFLSPSESSCLGELTISRTTQGGFLQRLLNAHTMPLSGLMTARFLLHLRKWQATESSSPDGYVQEHEHDGSERTHPLDVLVFSDPTRTTYGESDSDSELGLPQSGSASMSFVDQFGEDPVRRARAISGADFGYSRGDIVEESRV
ncbi:hypothetical protein FPV67DRAFT_1667835 [Lyophyllum atratum]|nr:hypothetical protein FPV67DRAFT_1667835 [Lyophyllum atratum]